MTEMVGGLRGMTDRLQSGIKNTSSSIALLSLRVFSAAVLGLTFGLAAQEIIGQTQEITLAFIFVFLTVFGAFWRLSRGWGFPTLLVVDLVLALIGMLLRLYVMMAPNV
jgi:hypothetical protein